MPDLPGGPDSDDAVLAELRALGRSTAPAQAPWEQGETWEDPPAGLWDRISAEALTTAPTPADADRDDPDRDDPDRDDGAANAELDGADAGGEVLPFATRSRRRAPWLLAAAAAVVVVLAAGVLLVQQGRDDPAVLAAAPLDRLGDAGRGTAELIERDGTLQLRVDTADLDPGDGFLEVWVIDPEVTKLVSLGPLRDDGIYDLPAGLDVESFPVVDVSVEPLDGDPTHSGDSRLRGTLEF